MNPHTPIELVVLDMAGTTVLDDGIVEQAFQRAAERTGVASRIGWEAALQYVRDTMGQSKIDVFTHLADGDVETAERATAQFEAAYAEIVAEQGVTGIPGAADAIRALRAAGLKVWLTTGFAPITRDALLDALGWRDLVDGVLSPVDAGRGRPAPDLVLAALLRAGASSVQAVAVAGDTVSDVQSGSLVGSEMCIRDRTGAHDAAALAAAGPDAVLPDVTALAAALVERGLVPGLAAEPPASATLAPEPAVAPIAAG